MTQYDPLLSIKQALAREAEMMAAQDEYLKKGVTGKITMPFEGWEELLDKMGKYRRLWEAVAVVGEYTKKNPEDLFSDAYNLDPPYLYIRYDNYRDSEGDKNGYVAGFDCGRYEADEPEVKYFDTPQDAVIALAGLIGGGG